MKGQDQGSNSPKLTRPNLTRVTLLAFLRRKDKDVVGSGGPRQTLTTRTLWVRATRARHCRASRNAGPRASDALAPLTDGVGTEPVLRRLSEMLGRFGLPRIIVIHNAMPFISERFRGYCKVNDTSRFPRTIRCMDKSSFNYSRNSKTI
ncbi:hypothetical protein EVAR_20157_1 [Eumeta japonica]|uniref:Uncharacterized protein n=1 Tax=Eumeta variegata TaxID=151549 RepID=A0A4C1V3Q1_EUMVA|nr:hypothetical protein EVAR_20157_1 [Eumeta japonica]